MNNFILILLIFSALLILFSNLQEPQIPTEFVDNRTVDAYSNLIYSYDIIRYPSSAEITPLGSLNGSIILGFVTDNWNLNFGGVPANGSYVTRTINLHNSEDNDVIVRMKSYGNITPMIEFERNDFVLKSAESTTVNVVFNSGVFDIGDYSGEIDIIIEKHIYNFPPIN